MRRSKISNIEKRIEQLEQKVDMFSFDILEVTYQDNSKADRHVLDVILEITQGKEPRPISYIPKSETTLVNLRHILDELI